VNTERVDCSSEKVGSLYQYNVPQSREEESPIIYFGKFIKYRSSVKNTFLALAYFGNVPFDVELKMRQRGLNCYPVVVWEEYGEYVSQDPMSWTSLAWTLSKISGNVPVETRSRVLT
jgi:hypothetical protein